MSTVSTRVRRPGPAAEVLLAPAAGVVSFALVATILASTSSVFVAVALGIAATAAIVEIVRRTSVAYAVPAAVGALVAFDWFDFPPTHPSRLPGALDLATLSVYLGGAVLVGVLGARAAH